LVLMRCQVMGSCKIQKREEEVEEEEEDGQQN
jgi:hypothetical protein